MGSDDYDCGYMKNGMWKMGLCDSVFNYVCEKSTAALVVDWFSKFLLGAEGGAFYMGNLRLHDENVQLGTWSVLTTYTTVKACILGCIDDGNNFAQWRTTMGVKCKCYKKIDTKTMKLSVDENTEAYYMPITGRNVPGSV